MAVRRRRRPASSSLQKSNKQANGELSSSAAAASDSAGGGGEEETTTGKFMDSPLRHQGVSDTIVFRKAASELLTKIENGLEPMKSKNDPFSNGLLIISFSSLHSC